MSAYAARCSTEARHSRPNTCIKKRHPSRAAGSFFGPLKPKSCQAAERPSTPFSRSFALLLSRHQARSSSRPL